MNLKTTLLPTIVILILGLAYLYLNRYDYKALKVGNDEILLRINKFDNISCIYTMPDDWRGQIEGYLRVRLCENNSY